MPRELVALAPREPVLRDYDEPSLGDDQVRVRTEFGAPKHGTELIAYRGIGRAKFPLPLGNMCVGVITEVGPAVTSLKVGDRVFGHLPLRETHTVPESRLRILPPELSPAAVVCLDPAEFAWCAVRDAGVRLGDRVALFGLGAIGLMAVQMALMSGAEIVFAIDPIAKRRAVAGAYGAETLDPTECDVVQTLKDRTDGKGVDVAIEASASYKALDQAIRSVVNRGTVDALSVYHGPATELDLAGAWHLNQVTLKSSRNVSYPIRDYPVWDRDRVVEYCYELLRRGKLRGEEVVTPRVPFSESAEAYRELVDLHPERSIKLGVDF